MDVKWIKIATDIFNDEKILLIEGMPMSDSILVIWLKLLTLAGKQNNSGVFLLNDRIAYTDEMLATIFRRDLNTVRIAIKTFEAYGMIEILEGVITIPNWSKHQTLDKLEKKNEYQKGYMKEYRAKQKQLACKTNVSKDVRPNCKTNVSALEEDKEEREKEEEDKDKDKEKKETVKTILCAYAQGELLEVLQEFVEMRKALKKPLTPKAIKMILKDLDNLTSDIPTQITIVEESIKHSWQGVFPLKTNNASNNTKATPAHILNKPEGVGMFD